MQIYHSNRDESSGYLIAMPTRALWMMVDTAAEFLLEKVRIFNPQNFTKLLPTNYLIRKVYLQAEFIHTVVGEELQSKSTSEFYLSYVQASLWAAALADFAVWASRYEAVHNGVSTVNWVEYNEKLTQYAQAMQERFEASIEVTAN